MVIFKNHDGTWRVETVRTETGFFSQSQSHTILNTGFAHSFIQSILTVLSMCRAFFQALGILWEITQTRFLLLWRLTFFGGEGYRWDLIRSVTYFLFGQNYTLLDSHLSPITSIMLIRRRKDCKTLRYTYNARKRRHNLKQKESLFFQGAAWGRRWSQLLGTPGSDAISQQSSLNSPNWEILNLKTC